jgi:hypothetical protein
VLRFADPASASAAAADLGDIAAKTGAGAQRAQIPGHPDAAATSYTLLLSGRGGPLRDRDHLEDAAGCPAAGCGAVRDVVEPLSFVRAHPGGGAGSGALNGIPVTVAPVAT